MRPDMSLSALGRRDAEAAERRSSIRERMETAVADVGELDHLRHRQELLVRAALEERPRESSASGPGSDSGLLLEENILLLKKQLNCLRKPDAGPVSQLQDMDRQINGLRLNDPPSHDLLETDSRPSSGFYDLSDGASGSLSNSSNSVFSECVCSMADTDGRVPPTDGLVRCLDCNGPVSGLCENSSSSSSVSLTAPHPPSLDSVSSDLQSKFQCDVDRYPRPLHAVAVQNPLFLQVLDHRGWTRSGETTSDRRLPPPPDPPVPQSSSWLTQKRLDGYIYSLLQRRPQSFRTSRPRTSIGTDLAKSVLRQASLYARQMSGSGSGFATLRGTSSPRRQRFEEDNTEDQQIQTSTTDLIQSGLQVHSSGTQTFQNKVHMNMTRRTRPSPPSTTPAKDVREADGPSASPEHLQPPCLPSEDGPRTSQPGRKDKDESPGLEPRVPTQGSSSENQDEAGGGGQGSHRGVHVKSICGTNVKTKTNQVLEHPDVENTGLHLRSTSTRHLTSEEQGQVTASRRAWGGSSGQPSSGRPPSRFRRPPASIPEDQLRDEHHPQSGATRQHHHCRNHHRYHGNHRHYPHPHRHHPHPHSRDQVVVVAKLKHKRSDYWRLRAVMGVPYEEAFRRTRRCPRQENVYLSSPYSYVAGSDSEYSAECASLFHSTVEDTSEDEKSDYTTNCFGDSESSGDGDDLDESATTGDVEERVGAGLTSRGRGQMGGGSGAEAVEQEVTQTKAFVKIKASHNLKKKILRFRGGSLKLMTTV